MGVEELGSEVRELIMNKEFLVYVFNPNRANTTDWALYLSNHPENMPSFYQAKYILQHLDSLKSYFREEDLQELKEMIRKCILHNHAN